MYLPEKKTKGNIEISVDQISFSCPDPENFLRGGDSFWPGAVQKLYHCKNQYFGKSRGDWTPYPLSGSARLFLPLTLYSCRNYMSRFMRKPTICEADQRLCFRYLDSTIPLLSKYKNFKPLAISSGCTAWFVSDLVRNHIVGFLMSRLI